MNVSVTKVNVEKIISKILLKSIRNAEKWMIISSKNIEKKKENKKNKIIFKKRIVEKLAYGKTIA